MADKPESCFWCEGAGTVLINGTPYCESHAMCGTCLQPLRMAAFSCRCDQDGYAGHEELLFCSAACLDQQHPDYDPGPIEEKNPA